MAKLQKIIETAKRKYAQIWFKAQICAYIKYIPC